VLGRGKLPEGLVGALASGLAATVWTLPVVAWHFEQVSVVGIPATLVAGPLVAVALPGAIASIAADFVSPPIAAFLAGGVGLLLSALAGGAEALGALPWAAGWATRTSVSATLVGISVATWTARQPWIGGTARRGLVGTYVSAAVLAWPVLLSFQGRGSVEVMMIDVGQGDAIAVRGPTGGWVLVDAGPPWRDPDPGAHPVVRALRGRGVRRLEALVLTHADLDHIGGAAAVLETLEVGAIYDPALPAGKDSFVDVLTAAGAADVPWLAATTGMRLELGDLILEVLSPSDSLREAGPEANEASVVLLARYGSFETLLTGDAYRPLERALAARLPVGIEVLKVGHHGSDTSTDPALLDAIRPSVALVSAGRGNRYGHPTAGVLESLRSRDIDIWRTDRDGTVTVVGRRDGRWSVR
jgi:competence protein ComEC